LENSLRANRGMDSIQRRREHRMDSIARGLDDVSMIQLNRFFQN